MGNPKKIRYLSAQDFMRFSYRITRKQAKHLHEINMNKRKEAKCIKLHLEYIKWDGCGFYRCGVCKTLHCFQDGIEEALNNR